MTIISFELLFIITNHIIKKEILTTEKDIGPGQIGPIFFGIFQELSSVLFMDYLFGLIVYCTRFNLPPLILMAINVI